MYWSQPDEFWTHQNCVSTKQLKGRFILFISCLSWFHRPFGYIWINLNTKFLQMAAKTTWEKILAFVLPNHWPVLAIVLEMCSVVLELFLIRLILEMRSAAVLRTSHPLVSTWPVPLRGLKAAGVGADGPAGGTISSVLSHTLQWATVRGCIS